MAGEITVLYHSSLVPAVILIQVILKNNRSGKLINDRFPVLSLHTAVNQRLLCLDGSKALIVHFNREPRSSGHILRKFPAGKSALALAPIHVSGKTDDYRSGAVLPDKFLNPRVCSAQLVFLLADDGLHRKCIASFPVANRNTHRLCPYIKSDIYQITGPCSQ